VARHEGSRFRGEFDGRAVGIPVVHPGQEVGGGQIFAGERQLGQTQDTLPVGGAPDDGLIEFRAGGDSGGGGFVHGSDYSRAAG
jgi:hypothetical protein